MLACAHTDVDLVSKFALGLRYRLQKEAYRMAGWKVVIPRHALVETVCRMLAPVQHGVKTRGQCMVCAQRRPITLHWTSAAFHFLVTDPTARQQTGTSLQCAVLAQANEHSPVRLDELDRPSCV